MIAREVRHPRLRTAAVLFGVITTAAASSAATHYALCDRDGGPACGNIGQLGRDAPTPVAMLAKPAIDPLGPDAKPTPVAATTTITHNAPLIQITITQRIVAPPPITTVHTVEPIPTVTPIADADGDFAPGNVMTKGGGSHR